MWIDRALDRINGAFAPFVERHPDDRGAPSGTADRLDRLADALLYTLSALLLIALTGAVTYSIFMRYAINRPPLWSEAVPMVFFIWMTFLALGVATRRGDNIRVTFFIEKLAPFNRLVLELVMHALVLVIMAVIFWFSFDLIRLHLRGTMLSTGWNEAIIWFPLPIGMVLMTLFQMKRIRWSIRTWRRATGTDERA